MQSSTSSTTDASDTATGGNTIDNNEATNNNDDERYIPPWSMSQLKDPSSKQYARFRQHVNPLSRRYQMAADLPNNWPYSDFGNVNRPLYLDIGCGKGGFLLELVGRRHGNKNNSNNSNEKQGGSDLEKAINGVRDDTFMNITKTLFEDRTDDWLPPDMNYLGLEIRPGVSQYAQARVEKRGLGGTLSFLGCNANVDLDRLLTLYQESAAASSNNNEDNNEDSNSRLAFVSIQYPDPHFKKAHSKRRVVTPELVTTLAKFMKEDDVVFLQRSL